MSKKKNKKTSKGKEHRKGDKQKRRADAGVAEIAMAERKLERSLLKLENVRAELSEREIVLRDLLVKHGRMPVEVDEIETVPLLDQQQVVHPLDGLTDGDDGDDDEAVVSVPLLDQQQVLDVGSREPVEHEN